TSPLQTHRVYFGLPKDTPVYGDFDGDLKTDIGVWREGTTEDSQSYFYILPSSNPDGFIAQPWGITGDLPVTGDFDGDSKTDFCVTRREGGQIIWHILPSGGGSSRSIVFGLEEDLENFASFDFDGDGLDDLIVTRFDQNGNLTHYIGDAQTGTLILAQQWGSAETAPTLVLFGNYIGDSRADIAVFYGACESNLNESNPNCEIGGTWWIKETGSDNYTVTKFGIPFDLQTNAGDLPNLGDYDGDGKFDISVFRRSNSTVYTLGSSNGEVIGQYWDGDSATPPSDTNMLENTLKRRGKSIPASALKAVMISKQPDGTFKMERASDFENRSLR
ncbi:MAG: FG-GAP-like repeat-containing protein, partial [Acidobacteriota bacterium]|nr:FG-GAP-like repeat-containing protein [Acidobacteriota bacterium]